MSLKGVLSHPSAYFYLRQLFTLGLPYQQLVDEFGLSDPMARIVDIGCGPADILRYFRKQRPQAAYLGIDMSERYLRQAHLRAIEKDMDARFEKLDLSRLESHVDIAEQFTAMLEQFAPDRGLLLGVIHHLNDHTVLTTLDLLGQVESLQRVFTWDVVMCPRRRVNNFLARHDRGGFVRNVAGYEDLLQKSGWKIQRMFWTRPGLKAIDYINFELAR
ncbi:MAG: class I SAM-dependent methyltransferase [Burkholderiales bacterium]|nr:class I SAM-dependent methyltransferase [Phycisphaerae bacterium]